MPVHQLAANAARKGARRCRADLRSKTTPHPAQPHLHVVVLGACSSLRAVSRARLIAARSSLCRQRPTCNAPSGTSPSVAPPSTSSGARPRARILPVGLHRHRLKRGAHGPCLQQLHGKPGHPHPRVKPSSAARSIRLRSSGRQQAPEGESEPASSPIRATGNPRHRQPELAEKPDQRLRLAWNLALPRA